MIRYIRHSEIDKELWDRRIASSPQGLVYAFSWYLDIVSPGWEALVADDYKSVFPLTHRKRAGISYLFQPYFTQQLGLFSGEGLIREQEIVEFLDAIPKKFRLIEIQLNTGNPAFKLEGFTLFPRRTYLLDLTEGIDKIRPKYSENLRRNLKKAGTSDIVLTYESSIKDVITLFRKNRGKTVENLKEKDYSVFEILIGMGRKKNCIEILSAMDSNQELLAAAVFLKSVHSYIFLFSATSEEGKNKGAMIRIIDSFIDNHCNKKTILDFEGSMDENLARFYKGFGAQESVYLQIRKNTLPILVRWLK